MGRNEAHLYYRKVGDCQSGITITFSKNMLSYLHVELAKKR